MRCLILDANPLERLRNIRTIHSVCPNGVKLDGAALLAGWKRRAAQPQ